MAEQFSRVLLWLTEYVGCIFCGDLYLWLGEILWCHTSALFGSWKEEKSEKREIESIKTGVHGVLALFGSCCGH